MIKTSIISLCFIFLCVFIHAQEPSIDVGDSPSNLPERESEARFPSVFNKITIGAGIAATLFHGDVAKSNGLPTSDNFGDAVKRNWNFAINRDDLLNDITGGGNAKTGLGLQFRHSRGGYGGSSSKSRDPDAIFKMEGYYHDFALGINYDVTWLFKGKKGKNNFKAYINAGAGIVAFRSILEKPSSKSIFAYMGYEPVMTDDGNLLRLVRGKRVIKKVFPFGVDFRFHLNTKLDINFFMLAKYTNTDEMDAFDRPSSRKDVYSAWGVGILYNFNRSSDEVFSKDGSDYATDFDFGGMEIDGANLSEKDKLYKLMLKLYETQLKLFELMYMGD